MSRRQQSVETISVHVPFAIRKYGGRKQVITPIGEPAAIERPRVDSTLVKALARAFRWKKMLESGQFTTITELAEHEKLGFSYMNRVLRLGLLAPEIVEVILEGRQPPEMTLRLAGAVSRWMESASRATLLISKFPDAAIRVANTNW